jgi:hypothetical protein
MRVQRLYLRPHLSDPAMTAQRFPLRSQPQLSRVPFMPVHELIEAAQLNALAIAL